MSDIFLHQFSLKVDSEICQTLANVNRGERPAEGREERSSLMTEEKRSHTLAFGDGCMNTWSKQLQQVSVAIRQKESRKMGERRDGQRVGCG